MARKVVSMSGYQGVKSDNVRAKDDQVMNSGGGGGGEPPDDMERRISKLEECANETRRDMSQIKEMLATMNERMATKDDIHKLDNRLVAVETKVSGLPSLGKIATLIGLFAAILPFFFGLLKHFHLV